MQPIATPPGPSQILVAVVVALFAACLIADIVILIRWLIYRLELQAYLDDLAEMGAGPAGLPEEDSASAPEVPELSGAGDFGGAAPSRSPALDHSGSTATPAAAWPLPEPPRSPFAPKWSLVHPFLGIQIVLGGVAVFQLAGIAALVVARVVPFGSLTETGLTRVPALLGVVTASLYAQNALFVAIPAAYIRSYGLSLRRIGLAWTGWRSLLLGLGLGLVLFACANTAEVVLNAALAKLLSKATMDALTKISKEADAGSALAMVRSAWAKAAFFVAGAIAAPIGEEVFFRGFVYNSLKARVRIPAAIVLSGFLFALIHMNPLAGLIIFPMGMLLAYVYERTRSLWVTICMHAVNNGISFAAVLLWPHAFK